MTILLWLLLATTPGEACSPQRIEIVSGQLTSAEEATRAEGWQTMDDCDPELWFPELCAVLELRRGSPELRSRLLSKLPIFFHRPRPPCEEGAVFVALHSSDSRLQLGAARHFAQTYPHRVPEVVEVLSDLIPRLRPLEDDFLVLDSLRLLLELGPHAADAEDAVISQLKSTTSEIRLLACQVLTRIRPLSPYTRDALRAFVAKEAYFDAAQCGERALSRSEASSEE